MKKISVQILISFLFLMAQGQQTYHFSLNTDNSFILNPAATGIENSSELNLSVRKQWHKVNSSPLTSFITFNSSIPTKHIGFGAFVYDDETGPTALTGFGASFAYRITNEHSPTFDKKKLRSLSFGISVSCVYSRLNFRHVLLDDSSDPLISNGGFGQKVYPDFSFGMLYSSSKFYVGVSIPQLLNMNTVYKTDGKFSSIKKLQHYYLTTGAKIIFRDKRFTLEPNLWFKYVIGGHPQGIVNLRFNIVSKGYVGLTYRSIHGLTFEGGIWIKKAFRIGYAYDLEISRLLPDLGMTHEIFLSYKFKPTYQK